MLKSLLLGSAFILAIPAVAQQTNPPAAPAPANPVGTTPTDHDPTHTDQDASAPAAGTPTIGTQVNGGVTTSAPASRTGATGTVT